jgi:hypothetical protein
MRRPALGGQESLLLLWIKKEKVMATSAHFANSPEWLWFPSPEPDQVTTGGDVMFRNLMKDTEVLDWRMIGFPFRDLSHVLLLWILLLILLRIQKRWM